MRLISGSDPGYLDHVDFNAGGFSRQLPDLQDLQAPLS